MIAKIEEGGTYPNNKGTLTVLEYVKAIKVLVKHNDEFGHEMWTQADRIRKGCVRNPFEKHSNGLSFTGYGYCCKIPKKNRDEIYRMWRGVVQRTLSEKYEMHKTNRSYDGATLCDRWHNFQTFCQDVYENAGYKSGYQIDKDLLLKGNKHYSPETCCFLPAYINLTISIMYKTGNSLPVGVNIKGSHYEAAISCRGRRKLLGSFLKVEDAHTAYVKAKESYVKDLALEYKEVLGKTEFDALMSWTVY